MNDSRGNRPWIERLMIDDGRGDRILELSTAYAEITRLRSDLDAAREALEEIAGMEDATWKIVRHRDEFQAELDEARHEVWTEAAKIARAALAVEDKEPCEVCGDTGTIPARLFGESDYGDEHKRMAPAQPCPRGCQPKGGDYDR